MQLEKAMWSAAALQYSPVVLVPRAGRRQRARPRCEDGQRTQREGSATGMQRCEAWGTGVML